MYASINKQVVSFQNCLGFSGKVVKDMLLLKMCPRATCRGQHVAPELQVKEISYRPSILSQGAQHNLLC